MATYSKCITTAELFTPKDVKELETEIKRVGGNGNAAAIAAAKAILERAQQMRNLIMDAAGMEEPKLTASNRAQTDTPEFKRWFGDSKVVDADGKPLVVYHGTAGDFSVFGGPSNIAQGMGGTAQSFFFTSTPGRAEDFAAMAGDGYDEATDTRKGGESIMPVYLSLKNPLVVDRLIEDVGEIFDLIAQAQAEGRDGVILPRTYDYSMYHSGGYDEEVPVYIAFRPEQIKSAIGNSGAFDPASPNITASNRVQTETPEFKRWFGDSKVVDGRGRPLVVYHATTYGDFNEFEKSEQRKGMAGFGFYFTSTEGSSIYSDYALNFQSNTSWRGDPKRVNVMPVYLRMSNPLEAENISDVLSRYGKRDPGSFGQGRSFAGMPDEAKTAIQRDGYDGVISKEYVKRQRDGSYKVVEPGTKGAIEHPVFVVFEPTQIKSAIGNSGAFDPASPNITASNRRVPIVGRTMTLPATSATDAARIKLQDDALRMRRVLDAVKAKGGKVTEAQNFYDANTLMPGRIQAAVEDFRVDVLRPMTERAIKADIEMDELAIYAYAKHATERNAYIASINPRLPDGGSGMTNADAAAILQRVAQSGKQADYDALHADLMSITATTRQLMLNEGLITQDEFDAMDGAYEFYIPLRGWENVVEETGVARPGVGRGVNIRGKETIRALGRTSRAGGLIENAIRDYERVIQRIEKNDVGKVLLDFVLSNPDPDLWGVDVVKSKPTFNKAQGVVQFTSNVEKGEDTIGVKVGGNQVYIKLADPELARALRQAWKDETSGLERATLAATGWWNNWLRAVLTRYNPAFAAINIPRDALWSGTTAALAELGPKGLARYTLNFGKALVASGKAELGLKADPLYDEFRTAGGITGGFYMRSVEDIKKDLQRDLMMAGPKSKAYPLKAARFVMKSLEFLGSASENATRFALYTAAKDVGKTRVEAALLAKNGTTNFNRKGEWGGALNNLYLFFNAGVQGTAQLGRVLKSPAVMSAMAGVAGVSAMLALYGASAGGEDDDGESYWDKVPAFEKERNLIIMLPPGEPLGDGISRVGKRGRYIKVPVQYGFNIFPNLGYMTADVWRNSQDKSKGVTPTKAALHMTSVVFGSVNPFGGSVDVTDGVQVLLAAMPTLVDLPIQLATERNTFGSPASPSKSSFDTRPDSERMFPSMQGTAAQKVAEALNAAGGGNEVKAGKILGVETSVTPGTIKTLISATGGGLGTFVNQMADSIVAMSSDDENLRAKSMPVVNRFYGEVDEDATIRSAAERRRQVDELVEEVKRQRKIGIEPELDAEANRLLDLAKLQERQQKELTRMRKEEVEIVRSDRPEAEKKAERKRLQAERDRLAIEFNKEFLQGMKQP